MNGDSARESIWLLVVVGKGNATSLTLSKG